MKRLVLIVSALALFSSAALSQQAVSKGTVLVDGKKMTLYTFDKDTDGKSTCNGTCAENWPPYTDKVDTGAGAGEWSAITRDDGKKMWAYKGKPVYFFKGDTAPGDMKGDGVNGVWHVVKLP